MKKKISWFLSLLLTSILSTGQAQEDFEWWNQTHNWDGKTHWRNYLIVSPDYFGPNALEIPRMNFARIQNRTSLSTSFWYHKHTEEQTINNRLHFYSRLFSNRVAFSTFIVPQEWYEVSPQERDRRRMRGFDAQGQATGDLWVETHILLFSEKNRFANVLFRASLRTASGGKLSDARYTDAPGYYFDVSFGRTLLDRDGHQLYASLSQGFYVWQLYGDLYRQNDAYLYGLALEWKKEKLALSTEWTGYVGYITNGDRPFVGRFFGEYALGEKFSINLNLQQGFRDYGYSSLGLGVTWILKQHAAEE